MFKDYEIKNPLAVVGSGAAGAGLGLLAYLMGDERSAARLAAYTTIGAALGVGTGAIATLAKKKSDKEVAEESRQEKYKNMTDAELYRTVHPVKANLIDLGAGASGLVGGRILRETAFIKPTTDYVNAVRSGAWEPGSPAVKASRGSIVVSGERMKRIPQSINLADPNGVSLSDRQIIDLIDANKGKGTANSLGLVDAAGNINKAEMNNFRVNNLVINPAVAAKKAVPASFKIGAGEDVLPLARMYFGNGVDMSKLSDAQWKDFARFLKKTDIIGPRLRDPGFGKYPKWNKTLRILAGLGGRSKVKSALLAVPELAMAAGAYVTSNKVQDWIRNKF